MRKLKLAMMVCIATIKTLSAQTLTTVVGAKLKNITNIEDIGITDGKLTILGSNLASVCDFMYPRIKPISIAKLSVSINDIKTDIEPTKIANESPSKTEAQVVNTSDLKYIGKILLNQSNVLFYSQVQEDDSHILYYQKVSKDGKEVSRATKIEGRYFKKKDKLKFNAQMEAPYFTTPYGFTFYTDIKNKYILIANVSYRKHSIDTDFGARELLLLNASSFDVITNYQTNFFPFDGVLSTTGRFFCDYKVKSKIDGTYTIGNNGKDDSQTGIISINLLNQTEEPTIALPSASQELNFSFIENEGNEIFAFATNHSIFSKKDINLEVYCYRMDASSGKKLSESLVPIDGLTAQLFEIFYYQLPLIRVVQMKNGTISYLIENQSYTYVDRQSEAQAIFVLNTNSDGKVNWLAPIPKIQVSPLMALENNSYLLLQENNLLKFYFTDTEKNYDSATKKFQLKKSGKDFKLAKSDESNSIACATVDENGNVEQRIIGEVEGVHPILHPGVITEDGKTIYCTGKKGGQKYLAKISLH